MNFNKEIDHIAVGIPYFRMRHTADWPAKMNEVNISTIAIDEVGIKSSTPSIHINSHALVNPVRSWERVDFAGDGGRLIYGPSNPGAFLFCACIYIERDDSSRDLGKQLEEVVKSDELQGITTALSSVPNPTAQLVTGLLSPVLKIVSKFLKSNKDDIIFTQQGTFFRDSRLPYNIGDSFTSSNKFIESSMKIIPLVNNSSKKNSVLESSLLVNDSLAYSKLAGEPHKLELKFGEA